MLKGKKDGDVVFILEVFMKLRRKNRNVWLYIYDKYCNRNGLDVMGL